MNTETNNKTVSKRIITTNVLEVNSSMMELAKICDYPAIDGISHAILSNGKIVNVVSDNYGYISNKDFFGKFEQILKDQHIGFKATYKNVNDCQFTVDYLLDGHFNVNEKATKYMKDGIQPKIRLTNSFDGKVKLAGYFGFFRQVCENGLHVMKDELAFSVRRNAGNIGLVFPNMREMLESYKENEMVTIIRKFEDLSNLQINPRDLQDVVRAIAEKTGVFQFEKSKTNAEAGINGEFVLNVIANEKDKLQLVPNGWLVYNAFNEWIYSEERNVKNDSERKNLDVKTFEAVTALLN